MSLDFVEYLRIRVSEEEERARSVPGPEWRSAIERKGEPGNWRGAKAELVTLPPPNPIDSWLVGDELLRSEHPQMAKLGRYATYWSPQRVLALCEAHRKLIDWHGTQHVCEDSLRGGMRMRWDSELREEREVPDYCEVLRILGLAYVNDSRYQLVWGPGRDDD